MDTHQDGPKEAVAAAILDYLRAHPMAADSADGVQRWWIGSRRVGLGVEEVESALDLLVERNLLRRLRLMDGTVLYAQVMPTRQ